MWLLFAAILARLVEIDEEFNYMSENYEGCDWCCGGGDQWWEFNLEQQEVLEQRLGEIALGFRI